MKKLFIVVLIIAVIVALGIYISREKQRVSDMIDRVERGVVGITQKDLEDAFKNSSSR